MTKEYLAEWAAKTGISEFQLEWLLRENADADNRQWDHLDEIRRLGT